MPRQLSRGDAPLTGKQPVWDLPVRLVHWLLAALIAFSWWSVKNHHTDWHIWSGIAILTLLVFRLLWGFVGSSTARWAGFVRGPRTVLGYLRGGWRGAGHTPLGAISVVAMFLAVAVPVGLGLVVLHLAAILFYRLRGQGLTWPMITGRAPAAPGITAMRPGKWWVALICLAVALGISRWVVAGAPLP